MKKTYNIIITLVALLAFSPFMRAQNPIPFPADTTIKFAPDEWNKEYTIDSSNVAYRKIISQPNTQGIYHILLDAFTTGREIKTQKAVKADIVLVLDISGSMSDYMGNQTRLDALKNAVYTFIDIIDQNDRDNAPTGQARLGNRIAIVPFSHQLLTSEDNRVRDFQTLENPKNIKNQVGKLSAGGGTYAHLGMEQALTWVKDNHSSAQIRTVVLFTDGDPGLFGLWEGRKRVGNYWRYATLSNHGSYDPVDHDGELNYENTLACANKTIDYASQIKALARDNSDPNKQVITNVFTVSIIPLDETSDFTNVYLGKASSNFQKDAKSMGNYTLTDNGYFNEYYRTTIHNWNSTDIWANGSGTRNTYIDPDTGEVKNETKYAITASDADQLEKAFATIAESSGGGSTELGESSIATVDVVSASFVLPPNADEHSIRVYTSKCINVPSSGQPVFGPDTLATQRKDKYQPMKKQGNVLAPDGNPKDVDDNILVTLNTSMSGKRDSISVNGFDYTNNWCGEIVENEQHVGWHGNKVTILIPIKMNPDALGGVGVDTNGRGSGIYVDGENKFPFVSPKVNLPVNIIINKQGLDIGESSKFTIYKSIDKINWTPVTSVFVTRHSGQGKNDPKTRIEGLPATDESNNEYIYKVVEDNWSWSYTLTSDNELLTDDNDNPFTFTNKKKDSIDTKIRHAESKATNTFKTGGGDKYDDSKSNGRTVITITTGSN